MFQNHWQGKKKNLDRQQEAKSTLFQIKELDGRFPQILTHFSDSEHTDCQHLCTCTKAAQTKKQHVGRWGKHYSSSGTASLFDFKMLLICYSSDLHITFRSSLPDSHPLLFSHSVFQVEHTNPAFQTLPSKNKADEQRSSKSFPSQHTV